MTRTSPQFSPSAHYTHERLDAVFSALAQRNRRQLLGTLYEQSPDSVAPRRLAKELVRSTDERSQQPAGIREAEIALQHSHLPKLEATGLISRAAEDGVKLTDHPALRDTGVVDVLAGETDATAGSLDELFDCLAHARRRTILDVLSHQLQSIHVETLAREVGARELDTTEQDVPTDDAEQIIVSLYHTHLPKLADADLISYDRDDDTVGYEGHPDLRVPWMHSVFESEFRDTLTDESTTQEIETIEGRERVVSYGQSMFDRTDEELFCMITDTDLLEAGCLTRIRQASRRGVTVYLGIRDPAAREHIHEHIPEVNLWKPKTDWLNLPVEGNTVGRLVLSDQNAVLLGTLNEPRQDGTLEEKAIIGDGADNALVVMVRQMISPHLTQIDAESTEIESELPF